MRVQGLFYARWVPDSDTGQDAPAPPTHAAVRDSNPELTPKKRKREEGEESVPKKRGKRQPEIGDGAKDEPGRPPAQPDRPLEDRKVSKKKKEKKKKKAAADRSLEDLEDHDEPVGEDVGDEEDGPRKVHKEPRMRKEKKKEKGETAAEPREEGKDPATSEGKQKKDKGRKRDQKMEDEAVEQDEAAEQGDDDHEPKKKRGKQSKSINKTVTDPDHDLDSKDKKRRKSRTGEPGLAGLEHSNIDAAGEQKGIEPSPPIQLESPADTQVPGDMKTGQNEQDKKDKQKIQPAEDPDPLPSVTSRHHASVLEKKSRSLRLAQQAAERTVEGQQPSDTAEPVPVIHHLGPLPQPAPAQLDDSGPLAYSTLPSWMSSPVRVAAGARASFESLGVPARVSRVLAARGFPDAFAVQTATIPLLTPASRSLPGDLLIAAATGSGKTLAYGIPLVRDVSLGVVTRLRALVVLPTRELVGQAAEALELCGRAWGELAGRKKIKIGVAVGSQTLSQEQEMLVGQEMRFDPAGWEEKNQKKTAPGSDDDDDYDDHGDEGGNGDPLPGHVWVYRSRVDVLVCTPGRLVEHMDRTAGFSLEYVRWLVVDEADKLLSQSFQGWADTVMPALRTDVDHKAAAAAAAAPPPQGARVFPGAGNCPGVRKVLLSATLTRDLSLISPLRLWRPRLVVLEAVAEAEGGDGEPGHHILPDELREAVVRVYNPSLKPLYLVELLESGRLESMGRPEEHDVATAGSDRGDNLEPRLPSPSAAAATVLVFTKSNESALRLGRLLGLMRPSLQGTIGTLTSTTPSHVRRRIIKDFGRARLRILVGSDLVARGIDLPRLDHVVNYDLPASLAGYVHRVGRTARAGRPGKAWTLLEDGESGWFWGRIGKGSKGMGPAPVARSWPVERVSIGGERGRFDDDRLEMYERALARLGVEAEEGRRGESRGGGPRGGSQS